MIVILGVRNRTRILMLCNIVTYNIMLQLIYNLFIASVCFKVCSLFANFLSVKNIIMACKTFHKGKYYVTFKRGFEDSKKDITVTVDKVFESDSLVSL